MTLATCSRVLQFRAGPNESEFCEQHRPRLETGDVSLFFPTADERVQPVDQDEEIPCYFCQEG